MHRREVRKLQFIGVLVVGTWSCAWLVHRRTTHGPARSRQAAAPVESTIETDRGTPSVGAEVLGPTRLSGSVKTHEGRPVAGARVCAAHASAEPLAEAPACTDSGADGAYEIDGVLPGGYAMTAEADGFFPGVAADGRWVVVAAGESKAGLDIVLEAGGAKVAGRVLDATGGVVLGTTSSCRSRRPGL